MPRKISSGSGRVENQKISSGRVCKGLMLCTQLFPCARRVPSSPPPRTLARPLSPPPLTRSRALEGVGAQASAADSQPILGISEPSIR